MNISHSCKLKLGPNILPKTIMCVIQVGHSYLNILMSTSLTSSSQVIIAMPMPVIPNNYYYDDEILKKKVYADNCRLPVSYGVNNKDSFNDSTDQKEEYKY